MTWVATQFGEDSVMISDQDRRDIREACIHTAVCLMSELDDLSADDESDTKAADRAVKIAKRFEQYVVDGL